MPKAREKTRHNGQGAKNMTKLQFTNGVRYVAKRWNARPAKDRQRQSQEERTSDDYFYIRIHIAWMMMSTEDGEKGDRKRGVVRFVRNSIAMANVGAR
jgi:hypothetical protein